MDEWEKRYWRLHRVVSALSQAVSTALGAGAWWAVHYVAKTDWGWGDWAANGLGFAAFLAVYNWSNRDLDLDR